MINSGFFITTENDSANSTAVLWNFLAKWSDSCSFKVNQRFIYKGTQRFDWTTSSKKYTVASIIVFRVNKSIEFSQPVPLKMPTNQTTWKVEVTRWVSKEKELFVFSEYPVRFQLLHHFSEITLGVVAFQNQMALSITMYCSWTCIAWIAWIITWWIT